MKAKLFQDNLASISKVRVKNQTIKQRKNNQQSKSISGKVKLQTLLKSAPIKVGEVLAESLFKARSRENILRTYALISLKEGKVLVDFVCLVVRKS